MTTSNGSETTTSWRSVTREVATFGLVYCSVSAIIGLTAFNAFQAWKLARLPPPSASHVELSHQQLAARVDLNGKALDRIEALLAAVHDAEVIANAERLERIEALLLAIHTDCSPPEGRKFQ